MLMLRYCVIGLDHTAPTISCLLMLVQFVSRAPRGVLVFTLVPHELQTRKGGQRERIGNRTKAGQEENFARLRAS